ncbi:MAG: phosphoribosylanthranilate isomerase [SAR324 cluster bacterium]|nr:phosphoribosylanthranilate isomerase [SAR324 cluster bacterium]
MYQVCVKICGLTSMDQAFACVDSGVSWLGFNCYPPSPRYISPETIRDICAQLPTAVNTVGVFVNEPLHQLEQIMKETGLVLAQLHGDETPEYTSSLKISWMKAFRASPEFEISQIKQYGQQKFLLDAWHPNLYGGSGKTIDDWSLAAKAARQGNMFLAGGLRNANIAEAIQQVKPFGVDVCSGIESSPGVKDIKKLKELLNTVHLTQLQLSANEQ